MISQSTAMLGLLTETSLHAGIGQMTGVIDLPIQREAHTDWPCVYGSAVKGAMRVLAENSGYKKTWVEDVFGPEIGSPQEHAGALSVGDARLLLLPVRSLTGHFKWITCPALLQRWQADYRRLQLPEGKSFTIPNNIGDGKALVHKEEGILNGDGTRKDLFLEEFRFEISHDEKIENIVHAICKLISRNHNEIKKALKKQLTIINDDIFAHLSRYATPVDAHIAIDNNTKTVKRGALWYEETLPSDTLLYTTLVAQKSRKPKSDKKAEDVLGHIINELFPENHPYLQLGGNETVGMGWCHVKVLRNMD